MQGASALNRQDSWWPIHMGRAALQYILCLTYPPANQNGGCFSWCSSKAGRWFGRASCRLRSGRGARGVRQTWLIQTNARHNCVCTPGRCAYAGRLGFRAVNGLINTCPSSHQATRWLCILLLFLTLSSHTKSLHII